MKVDANRVQIVGLSPEGTLFGIYELLEQIGVRWFMPGELGTVIPAAKTVIVARAGNGSGSIVCRALAQCRTHFPEWGRHVRMGGPYFPPAHGIPGINDTDFSDASGVLRAGKRQAHHTARSTSPIPKSFAL